jgi:membrane protein DedA with SNARE-associated domain
MAALGSAIGSLIWYYIGRAGGELILLKRINRERYEQIRDRFEKQEFLAILVPAMMPPPTPVKLFEIAAGVFEMKPLLFFSAIFAGKFIRFLISAIITITYGPAILNTITHTLHEHLSLVLGIGGILLILLLVYVLRKVFDRRRGTSLPVEEDRPAV